ncbi:MAG: hypothetical protein LC775_06450 [Acidobacteria bacterium]|nr:hypothetical protein [Acidobacteriota bacterium]
MVRLRQPGDYQGAQSSQVSILRDVPREGSFHPAVVTDPIGNHARDGNRLTCTVTAVTAPAVAEGYPFVVQVC